MKEKGEYELRLTIMSESDSRLGHFCGFRYEKIARETEP